MPTPPSCKNITSPSKIRSKPTAAAYTAAWRWREWATPPRAAVAMAITKYLRPTIRLQKFIISTFRKRAASAIKPSRKNMKAVFMVLLSRAAHRTPRLHRLPHRARHRITNGSHRADRTAKCCSRNLRPLPLFNPHRGEIWHARRAAFDFC